MIVAGHDAYAEAAYYTGFFIEGFVAGLQNKPLISPDSRYFTPEEQLANNSGNNAAQSTKDALKQGI
jgi:hypothetical protein